jgi:hypothetical protein
VAHRHSDLLRPRAPGPRAPDPAHPGRRPRDRGLEPAGRSPVLAPLRHGGAEPSSRCHGRRPAAPVRGADRGRDRAAATAVIVLHGIAAMVFQGCER